MNKIIKKLNKLSLPAVILMASIILGGFYYVSQVNKQHSIEKQQSIEINQEKEKELREQQAKDEAEQVLNDCIAKAESNYSDRWYEECKEQDKLTNKCIDVNELSYDEYLKKYGLTKEEYVEQRGLTPGDPDDPDSVWASGAIDYIVTRPSE